MASSKFCFELICIDPAKIGKDLKSFVHGVSYPKDLWGGNTPSVKEDNEDQKVLKGPDGLLIYLQAIDTSKILTDMIEAAFVLRLESTLFEPLEPLRHRILRHLDQELGFSQIRVLRDDISSEIANQLYPKINLVENLLRRYLTKFFIQRVGPNWWDVTATPKMIEKVNARKRNRSNQFTYIIESNIEYADFDDLGLLIYKQSTGFNEPEKVIEKLNAIETLDELDDLKAELQGNYTKYFKKFFRDKNFEKQWKEMSRIRNKVAHQATFFHDELKKGIGVAQNLIKIIQEAERNIDDMVLSHKEKRALHEATVSAIREEGELKAAEVSMRSSGLGQVVNPGQRSLSGGHPISDTDVMDLEDDKDHDHRIKLEGPKVIGKIKLEHKTNTYSDTQAPGYRVISEEEVCYELGEAERLDYTDYVGLKWFVTTYLANKGYAIKTTYSLVNILIEENKIDLYEMSSPDGWVIKAVRLPR
ncbi:MAG: hypothetical protein AAFY36_12450 [Bacteroidota bacterium]